MDLRSSPFRVLSLDVWLDAYAGHAVSSIVTMPGISRTFYLKIFHEHDLRLLPDWSHGPLVRGFL